ncbi:MAG: hypothetical protein WCT06_08955, partial [Armatimonadota bacterium]
KEINYILSLAKKEDARKVQLGELLLFSTQTGDAWILDQDDNLAICLMRGKEKQKYKIIDTPTQFGFDWDYKYFIEEDCFITIDKKGVERKIFGYQVNELR